MKNVTVITPTGELYAVPVNKDHLACFAEYAAAAAYCKGPVFYQVDEHMRPQGAYGGADGHFEPVALTDELVAAFDAATAIYNP